MRAVLQRVKQAQVTVDGNTVGKIGSGVLIFLGIAKMDSAADADFLASKITQLRIFDDEAGKMNRSAAQENAAFLVVSQFTLYGDCLTGRRPSFDKAADPKLAEELYEYFVTRLRQLNAVVETGKFRAMMEVSLINDGPVTFILNSVDQ
jgi:D-tyrosyl-tRNA(Tyr) deacylase